MNDNYNTYRIWAPDNALWTQWAKPVLFARTLQQVPESWFCLPLNGPLMGTAERLCLWICLEREAYWRDLPWLKWVTVLYLFITVSTAPISGPWPWM